MLNTMHKTSKHSCELVNNRNINIISHQYETLLTFTDGGELDISDVLCNRMKEKINSAKREENKENRNGQRSSSSSDYGSLYGYGSDSSANSKNNTAKEFPRESLDLKSECL